MIIHDPTFEALATAPVKQSDVQVIKQLPEGEVALFSTTTWSSSDVLMEVTIDAIGAFLGTTTKKATVKLIGIVEGAVAGDLFEINLGLYDTALSEFNYASQGIFVVDTVDYNYDSGFTVVNMYDRMWEANNTPYSNAEGSTAGFSYPTTIQGLAEQMAAAMGLELMLDFANLPNADFVVAADPYATISNATLQSVVHEIAGATGTTARVTGSTLEFTRFEIDDENLNSEELKSLKIGKQYGPVTSVVLGRVPQNDNIALSSSSPTGTGTLTLDPGTDLFTFTGHGLSDGSLIRFLSDDTYPAPLLPDTNYYVYTDEEVDTFALAPTYADALAGTNLIDITTAGVGNLTISHLQTQEVQINNNQLLDQSRQETLPEIYAELVGIGWHEVNAETVGLGWHEVGDVIQFTQGTRTVRAFLNEVHLTLAGSVKEKLVSTIPDVATINYQTAGGILKTLYNTEIRVDKQNQEIVSVVEQQEVYADQVNTNFSQVYQDLENILITIQRAGGGNLILNSIGYAKEAILDVNDVSYDKLLYWDYPENYDTTIHGRATSYQSSESQNYGGISGRVIELTGDMVIETPEEEKIEVATNTPLSFGLMVNNALGTGDALITIYNDNDTFTIPVDDINLYSWTELKIENFVSSMPWLRIKIEADNADRFMFTDLRLLYGSTLQGWVQSHAELLSANVQFTKDGMRIFDSIHDTETRVTYNEFSTVRKSDGVVLFEADDTGVITNDLTVKGSVRYMRDNEVVIKQITIPNSNAKAGIAFIKAL